MTTGAGTTRTTDTGAETLAPDDPRLSWDGIGGWSGDSGRRLPLRMPVERLATAMSANFSRIALTTAGVRFAVRTDAAELTLDME
ncbi:hypothetical protein ACWGAA_39935, partial [Streptomyces sp. NPDC055080]